MNPLVIRAATGEDAPALASLLGQLGYASSETEVHERLERMMTQERINMLVAVRGTEVLGLATAHRLSLLNRPRDVMHLTALVVDRNARGQGVGRGLVAAVEERARAAGCERLSVATHVDRDGAHAFYERLGFALTGRRYARVLDG